MIAATIDRDDLRRWLASAAVVLGLHAAAAAALVTWRDPITIGEPSDAIVVDLTPFTAPSSTVEDVAPGPKQEEAEQPPPEPAKVEQKVEEKIELPPAPSPSAVTVPSPEPPKPELPTPVPPAPATTAPPPARASQAQINSWHSSIVTQLDRHKSYPEAARSRDQKGVVQLAFSLDRHGRVVSSGIVRSSGYAALDEETIAAVRRAQPFPPPPPGLAGAKFDFTLPVKFNIR